MERDRGVILMLPDQDRGEVVLPFGQRELILRLSYAALGKLIPALDGAPVDVVDRRRSAYTAWAGEEPVAMEWQVHLLGAVAAAEVETIAVIIAAAAHEHHPEVTPQDVMTESPPLGMVRRVCFDLVRLSLLRPGQEPLQEEVGRGPFVSRISSGILAALRLAAASRTKNSGNSHASS